jgi:hypothetical protein
MLQLKHPPKTRQRRCLICDDPVWVGYIALFGIAVETGVVMVVYLHEALDRRLAAGFAVQRVDIEKAAIEGAVQRLRPKLAWPRSCGRPALVRT